MEQGYRSFWIHSDIIRKSAEEVEVEEEEVEEKWNPI